MGWRCRGIPEISFIRRVLTSFQLIAGTPLYAHLFFLIRTGHLSNALNLVQQHTEQLERKDPGFVGFLRAWIERGRRFVSSTFNPSSYRYL